MKAWLALSLLVLAAGTGFNLAGTARRTPPPSRLPATVPADNVRRQEQRLAPLRAELAARAVRGPLGYIGDVAPPAMGGDAAAMEQYFLTQFVLLPWVLDTDPTRCAWALVNVRRAPAAARQPAGFAVVADCGDGVLLLRRLEP